MRRVPARLVVPLVLGTLLNALNSSMIAVALVAIGDEFHAGAEVVWLVSGLYLATAVGQPMMGRLADQFGPRRVFIAGLFIVMVAATLAPFAPGLGWLVAARVLLGIGTSAGYPAGVALIRRWADEVGDANPMGGLSAISAAGQSAVAFGPPLGGVLILLLGWRSIFWVNLPVAIASLVLVLLWVRPDGPVERASARDRIRQLDLPGSLLFVASLTALLLALLTANWWLLAATVLGAVGLIWWELRASTPFIDVRMLVANRALSRTYLRQAVTYVLFYSVFFGLPNWLERGRGLTSAQSGLVVLPVAGVGVLTTVIAARLIRTLGVRPVLAIGSGALLVGSAALLLVHSHTELVVLVLIAAVLGIPNGFNGLGNQSAMYAVAPTSVIGVASGLLRTAQYVGANMASALLGLTIGAKADDAGLHELAMIMGVLSVGLLAFALVALRRGGRVTESVGGGR
ncbi:sugar phosphate permease [Labedaea rhizosphaerae]|uniref:Sugar phosphate permease n=1 Tax=Labedaea rhizosphaerae TaxID=598644 RepID=A0A4R6SBV7_LABRH|nr:sugar phosphate permease [Labedaea rhizosphaerae]